MNKEEFIEKWLNNFVPNLTEELYKTRIENQYIWHAFQYIKEEKYLVGEEARKAYDTIDKKGCLVFRLWDNDGKIKLMNNKFDTSSKLDNLRETYVVSADFSWTYISTHENDCQVLGPYFMKK